jgi:ribosomal protein S18 acetylase RimI-like enzyme
VDAGKPIGCVVGKIDREEIILNGQTRSVQTGYIGMLAVQSSYRRTGIGKALVRKVLERMKSMKCQSVTLETGKY